MNISRGQLFTFAAIGATAFVAAAYLSSRSEIEERVDNVYRSTNEEINSPKPEKQILSFDKWLKEYAKDPNFRFSNDDLKELKKGYSIYKGGGSEGVYAKQHVVIENIKIGIEYQNLLAIHKTRGGTKWVDQLSASLCFNEGQIPIDEYISRLYEFPNLGEALFSRVGIDGAGDYLKKEIMTGNDCIPFPYFSKISLSKALEDRKNELKPEDWIAAVERGEKSIEIKEQAILIHCLEFTGDPALLKKAKRMAGDMVSLHLREQSIPDDHLWVG